VSGISEALAAHLASGATTVARCFAVTRRDGATLGFTDHDRDLSFGGVVFRADAGLTARALEPATGLSVDNSEVLGALVSESLTEIDILAGRYDGAEVGVWIVNWANPGERTQVFRGMLGEISRRGAAFNAELRGLTDLLNQPQGRIYHSRCAAVLGDSHCRFDLDQAGFSTERGVEEVAEGRVFRFME